MESQWSADAGTRTSTGVTCGAGPDADATAALIAHALMGSIATVWSALDGLRRDWPGLREEDRLAIVALAERQARRSYDVLGEVVRGLPGGALDPAIDEASQY
jgi:hypothetical protein